MRLLVAIAASPCLDRSAPGFFHKAFLKSRNLRSFSSWQGHVKVVHIRQVYLTHPRCSSPRATLDSEKAVSTGNAETYEFPPPGCTRIKVELNKPLGIVLQEDKVGNIFVAEIVKNGNADKSGLVDVGDQLIATSAIVYANEDYYQGVGVRKGMQVVRLSTFGEKFETVMAAIGTHPAHVKVALEIQKCQRPGGKAQNNGAAN